MPDFKWVGRGVFSFERRYYRHGDKMPIIPPETLKSLKKRKLIEKLAKTDRKEAAAEVAAAAKKEGNNDETK